MPRQANGQFIAPANTAAVSGQAISSTAFNTLETDIGTEITNSLDRNGRSAMLAALPMGNNKITGMADPAVPTDGTTKNYVDTAIATSATAVTANISVPLPQGYLTPTSNTPIITGDVISSTNVFYTPKDGAWLPLHNGTTIISYLMPSQFQLALTSSQAANNIYDIFLAYNGNVPVIGTGPSWAAGTGGSVTPGSCARGTGVGGAALTRFNGFNVNAASMSLIWNTGSGNTTITVPANQGIYLGSIFIDSVAGQVTLHRSYGQSRKWGVWNAYNRKPIYLSAGDPTTSWPASTNASFTAANGAAANSLSVFSGLAEEECDIKFVQNVFISSTNTSQSSSSIGIGINSTSIATGLVGTASTTNSTSSNTSFVVTALTPFAPTLGISTITALQKSPSTNGLSTFSGTSVGMQLTAQWAG